MTRKRLSDLIQEEGEKAPDEKALQLSSEEPSSSEDPTTEQSKRRKPPTKAQLEEALTELTAVLESENQRADSLQEKVNSLESELKDQKTLVQSLESKLQQNSHLQAELEEQKTLVEKFERERQHFQAVQTELEEYKQLVQKLQTQTQQSKQESVHPALPKLMLRQETSYGIQPSRPIGRASDPSSTKLTDEDIGWFD